MLIDDAGGDGESQARAIVFGREKGIEDLLAQVSGYAGALVIDLDAAILLAVALAAAAGDRHAPIGGSGIERVEEEIQDYLRQLLFVSANDNVGSIGMGSYGDAVLRQHLKALFFQKVSVPRGRDLARLDLTEAALVSLDAIFDSLPGESRPREDERYSTAFALGKTFADFMLSGQDKPVEYLARRMTSAIRKSSRLDWDQRHQVVAMILPLLGSFLEEVCGQCPVSCLERPKSKVEDIFFSPTHPMEPRQAE